MSTATAFHCTLSSAAASACNYEEIRDRLVSAVINAHRAADPEGPVTCRVFAGVGKLLITGEARAEIDVEEVARAVLRACSREARHVTPPLTSWEACPDYVI